MNINTQIVYQCVCAHVPVAALKGENMEWHEHNVIPGRQRCPRAASFGLWAQKLCQPPSARFVWTSVTKAAKRPLPMGSCTYIPNQLNFPPGSFTSESIYTLMLSTDNPPLAFKGTLTGIYPYQLYTMVPRMHQVGCIISRLSAINEICGMTLIPFLQTLEFTAWGSSTAHLFEKHI